ncbi:VCBS repeat-containing protein [Hymenobacter sp. BT683]|uniref:VCBS repeat-containing protein n=1 Tax=Hymenobacter jeongseonensis TaxID=2791027 RepID=A0ABS0ICN0_9BACT|nr:VCBS repeat-containing protein [Hymenobacter jeongseonensis]
MQPGRSAVAAPRTAPVSITLSQAVASVSAGTVEVHSVRAGGRKAGTFSANGSTIVFAPTTPFLPGETVQVTVPATVQSTGGIAAIPYCYQFTTGVDGFGGGTFAPPAAKPSLVPVATGPSSLVLGDVDGDGDLDLLVGTGENVVSVRLNSGLNSGNFVSASQSADFPLGSSPGLVRLALGDIDGDTDLDLLATLVNGSLAIRLNNGVNSGFFVPPNQASVSVGSVPVGLALGDIDGDGDLDVLTANAGSNTVSIRRNDGVNSGVFWVGANSAEVSVGTVPSQVLLGDIDGDGDLDLVAICAGNTNVASVRLNSGLNSGTFGAPTANADFSLGAFTRNATLGDINNDGYPDLVVSKGGATDGVDTWLNNMGNGFSAFQSMGVSRHPLDIALGDVDGDGDLDMLIGNDNNTATVTLRLNAGLGSGIFVEPVFTAEPGVGASFPWAVALGDVDGDGTLDLITANNNNSGSGSGGGSGTVSVRLNQLSSLHTALNPASGSIGAAILLRGTDVTRASAVSFNGTPVPAGDFSVVSPTLLRVRVPGGATSGPVTITTPQGILTSSTQFIVSSALATAPQRPTAGLLVYPSPSHGRLTVVVPPVAGVATAHITLLNMLGQTMQQRQVSLPAGGAQVNLDGSQLSAGIYVVRLQAGVHTETRHVVIE